MRRLHLTALKAIFGRLPASLNLLLPSTQTTQARGIVLLNFWLRYNLKRQFRGQRLPKILNVGHHESHAAIFFASPFEEASILVIDGYGDDAATSTFTGTGNRVDRQWQLLVRDLSDDGLAAMTNSADHLAVEVRHPSLEELFVACMRSDGNDSWTFPDRHTPQESWGAVG